MLDNIEYRVQSSPRDLRPGKGKTVQAFETFISEVHVYVEVCELYLGVLGQTLQAGKKRKGSGEVVK